MVDLKKEQQEEFSPHFHQENPLELKELASMIAHKIRNPLGGIKGFASLLERDLSDRPELQQMASYIIKGTDNLNQLVSTILEFAEPIKIKHKNRDLVALCEEVRNQSLTESSYIENIKIEVVTKEKEISLPFDYEQLRIAIKAMVLNAIQAMQNGGKISLILQKYTDRIELRIVDVGIGIPKQNLPKIFSPFFTTRADGNGFGLSEVKKIILAHKGSISVTSTVGQGSTFTMTLPLEQL